MRKIPARYFLVISLLLAVCGCDGGGGVPPPMVINTDPDFDGPATDVVPVVGDLGGSASVDVWVGSGSFDSGDDPSSLDGWLGILDSGYDGHVPTQMIGHVPTEMEIMLATMPIRALSEYKVALVELLPNAFNRAIDRFLDDFGSYDLLPNAFNRAIDRFLDDFGSYDFGNPIAKPIDESYLNGRSWGVQDYSTPKDSKTQEVIQDVKTVPAKGDVIAPELKPAATSGSTRDAGGGFFERKRELLEDAKGVSGTGNTPASTGGRRQEILDEAKLTPSSGKASDIGSGRKQELLESSKGNSFNAKNSLEEKSFKNSGGEKSSRSTFTGDKVFSQQGSKSFAPMIGKTHTFSGTGTRTPTSGKSFKMHGF